MNFSYTVVEGRELIEVIHNNDVFNVRAVSAGTALIRIQHPLAEFAFDVRIFAIYVDLPLITVDSTFVLLRPGDTHLLRAELENPRTTAWMNGFTHEVISGGEFINVTQTNNSFHIQALYDGAATLEIRHEEAQYSREILFVVRTGVTFRDDYFITTSQNVIQTQVGDSALHLNMILVGGTSADANNFRWTVSDGSIINVESPHGRIDFATRRPIQNVFTATAVITPRRTGVATITIDHPKSENTATVLVRVYPRGTFAGTAVHIGTEGLIRVLRGSELPITPTLLSGQASNVGALYWETAEQNIASLQHATTNNLTANIIRGGGSGVTTLRIDGEMLRSPHEALVLVGTQEEIDTASVIYVDNIFQDVAAQQVVRVAVRDSRSLLDIGYTVFVEHPQMLHAVISRRELILQGIQPGETTVTVRHPDAINDIVINVRVHPRNVTIDQPFFIGGPEIIGLVRGRQETINVTLPGAPARELQRFTWTVEDPNVLDIIQSGGTEARITGRVSGSQTMIRVSHPGSQFDRNILVFVVENEADLNNVVAMDVERRNNLITVGEELFIRLITNANDFQRSQLTWEMTNAGIITIDPHYDSAMVRATGVGNTEIIVRHPLNLVPLSIFVSVVDVPPGQRYISAPSVIELIVGQNRIIQLNHRNLSQAERNAIRWSVEDATVARVQENGDSAHIIGLNRGVTHLNITQPAIGFAQRVTVLSAMTQEELESMHVMSVDTTHHRMMVNDERRIQLQFGSAGFPEDARAGIQWVSSANNVVRVVGNGDSATVVAMNEGVGTVTASSPVSLNSVTINFEVTGRPVISNAIELRPNHRIRGIVVGSPAFQITINMLDEATGQPVHTGATLLEFDNENNSIIGVNLVNNILNITALASGQSFITVRHPRAREDARILIHTALTQEELDNRFLVFAEKTHHLIQREQSVTVELITEDRPLVYIRDNLTFGNSNAAVLEFQRDAFNPRRFVVRGRAAGEGVISVNYRGQTVERVYFSVVENLNVDLTRRISTESIVGLVRGQSRDTTVWTNLTTVEEASLVWASSNPALVTVAGNGRTATITATSGAVSPAFNETYVTVTFGGWLRRHILVFVCETQQEVDNYRAMNMDNQYIRMARGDTVILPMFYAPNRPTGTTMWTDRYGNNVVQFTSLDNGDRVEVTAINEGVAVLEARNTGRSNPNTDLRIFFEVSNQHITPPPPDEIRFLTAARTVFAVAPDPRNSVELSVTAIGMTPNEIATIDWDLGPGQGRSNNLITVVPNGSRATVRVNGTTQGESTVRAWHPLSSNIIEMRIIVTDDPVIEGVPHIVFEDIVRIGLGQERHLTVSLAGVNNFNADLFTVSVDNGNAQVSRTGNLITVRGVNPGQSRLTISHPAADFDKQSIIAVTATPDDLIFITTRENFSLIQRGDFHLLRTELVGFDDVDDGLWTWSIAPGHENYIEIHGNGRQAQVRGREIGTARVTVNHAFSVAPLTMHVRVSELDINPPFITTGQNIVSLIEGRSINLNVELVNGPPGQNMHFHWENVTPHIMNIHGAGNSAFVQALSPGIGRVRVTNPVAAFNSLEILVVVERDTSHESIYITTNDMLVDMSPGQTGRVLTVRLVGGNPEDVFGFRYELVSYNSVERWADGTSRPVVQITHTTADRVFLNAINEGDALIRVFHPRARFPLEVRVDVRHTRGMRFVHVGGLNIDLGETQFINMEAPTGMRVIYESSNENIVRVSGTNRVSIIEAVGEGVAIVTARNVTGTLSAELLVQVRYVPQVHIGFIRTASNLITLSTHDQPFRVRAEMVGVGTDGLPFTDMDYNQINWAVDQVGDVVQLIGNNVNEVSINPRNAGNAEIRITHPRLATGYVRRIFIQVNVEEVIFNIDNQFLNLHQHGNSATVSVLNHPRICFINDVRWLPNEYPDIIMVHPVGGNNQTVHVTPLNPGRATLSVIYNETTVRTVTIFVEEEHSITVISQLRLLPGERRVIEYDVRPGHLEVFISLDSPNFVHFERDRERPGEFVLTGRDVAGMTAITLRAANMERRISVMTHTNWEFRALEPEIRVRPRSFATIEYHVEPVGDIIRCMGPPPGWITWACPLNCIHGTGCEQTIIGVQVGDAPIGNDVLQIAFESTFNAAINSPAAVLDIDVFVYFPVVDFRFQIRRTAGSGPVLSRIDYTQSAIFLADGETITLYAAIDERNYPLGFGGHGLVVRGPAGAQNITAPGGQANPNTWLDPSRDQRLHGRGTQNTGMTIASIGNTQLQLSTPSRNLVSATGVPMLAESIYAGVLHIRYNVWNGGRQRAQFQKTFMVFHDIYRR